MAAAMAALVGTTEHPPGSNINAITHEFGMDGGAWCDMTVSVAGKHAGGKDIIGWYAYTVSHAKWFNAQGDFHIGANGIKIGDIVFFDFGVFASGRWLSIVHVGLVIGLHADGRVVTIEGNTDNACRVRIRSRSLIAGYGRPNYTPVVAPPVPPKPKKPAPKPVPPMLKRGSKGAWVKVLQRKLAHLVVDGDFGRKTDASVRVYQRGHKLVADGVVGPKTWAKLGY